MVRISKIDKEQGKDIQNNNTKLAQLEKRVEKLERFAKTSDVSLLE